MIDPHLLTTLRDALRYQIENDEEDTSGIKIPQAKRALDTVRAMLGEVTRDPANREPDMDTLVPTSVGMSVIHALLAVGDPSIGEAHGECSYQAIVSLESGATVRFGVTDDVGSGYLWIDGTSAWCRKARPNVPAIVAQREITWDAMSERQERDRQWGVLRESLRATTHPRDATDARRPWWRVVGDLPERADPGKDGHVEVQMGPGWSVSLRSDGTWSLNGTDGG